jgi:GNAT superfamily N-acetyltransferase
LQLINNKQVLVPNKFIEDWDLIRRRKVAEGVLKAIEQDAISYGAFFQDEIIGFIYLSNVSFGSSNQYVELLMFQVSEPYRKIGIGKELFKCVCESARLHGISKLYISAHSSKESQAAYRKLGCINAIEINKTIAENEPFDIQMEYQL